MMRPMAFRRPRVAALKTGSTVPQRRSKMYLRNQEKNGDIYYTLNRQSFPPKPIEDRNLFSIGDLLLDLDAEDSKYVRQYTDEDEAQMQKSWKVDHMRQRIEKRVNELESQVNWSREKVFKLTHRPTNIWRPGTSDIFSVALSTESQRVDTTNTTMIPSALPAEIDVIKTLRSESGLSNRMAANDQMLLSWLKLRHTLIDAARGHEAPLSSKEVKAALQTKTSITGIRRLISQSLSSGLSPFAFQKGLSSDVRRVLEDIISNNTSTESDLLHTLTFLSNLKERLSLSDAHMGGPLCGLGLRLTAEIPKPEASLEYLNLGSTHNLWRSNAQGLEDVKAALCVYEEHFREMSETRRLDQYDRQTLLLFLTGFADGDTHSTYSVRSLISPLLHGEQQQASAIYRSYIILLGRLGAVRTLWKEWRLTAHLAKSESGPKSRTQPEESVVQVYASAIRAAMPNMAQRDWETTTDTELSECVIADYQAIQAQGYDHSDGNWQVEAWPQVELDAGDCREALQLPIDRCLEAIGRWARKTNP